MFVLLKEKFIFLVKTNPIFIGAFVVSLIVFLFSLTIVISTRDNQRSLPPEDLSIISTIPINSEANVGIYPTIKINFSRVLTSTEKRAVKVTINPSAKNTMNWRSDSSTLTIDFAEVLLPNQEYTLIISYLTAIYSLSFKTSPLEQITTDDQIKAQSEADRNFTGWERSLEKYPWYDKFPLHTENYYVYFDLDKKSFSATLFPSASSTLPIDQQVETFKREVEGKIISFGISLAQYPILWEVTPEP